jgi:Tfp pilus assembly protein PilZ
MKEKFYAGKRTGSKVDPYKATADMRYLKDGGQFVFKNYCTRICEQIIDLCTIQHFSFVMSCLVYSYNHPTADGFPVTDCW